MTTPGIDQRTPAQRARDEQIAAEPQLPPPELPADAVPSSMEAHPRRRRAVAVTGIVENGLVRPVDPTMRLPEHSPFIIVAAEET